MDFQEFGIDPRLVAAIQKSGTSAFFFEKMLSRSLKQGENVCARITLDSGREEVILLPALQWILSAPDGECRKALVASADRQGAERIAEAARRIGGGAGLETCLVDAPDPEGGVDAAATGDPSSSIVVGSPEALLAASAQGLLTLRDYGFLIVDGADRLAELPSELMRKLAGSLLPPWERRSVLACDRITVKAKNLAWDIADNPCEISVEGEVAKAQSVAKETWRVASESKFRFLLGRIEREKPVRFCVFCNLRDTAEELSRRLEANGVASDYILGALAVERKLAVLDKIESGRCAALILTDKGAEGLPTGRFPLVVNYDFPLEPEYFVKRLEMLDRAASGAKVLSLACDRYIYGLPAVEQYIDAKLDAVPADDSLLAAEDKSAGMAFERRDAGRDGRDRDGRGGDERRGPRYGDRDDRGGREGGRRDGYYREDRGPDIRRSISEATGGSLDVGGEAAPERPRERARPAESRAPAAPRQGAGGGRDERRPSRRPDGRDNRRPARADRDQNRGDRGGDRASSRDRGRRDERPSGNPYELPMEERMKRYREKYGQRVVAPSKRNPPPSSNHSTNSGRPPEGGGAKNSSERSAPRAALPPDPSPDGRKADGILGKLFGSALRKKQE